VLTKAVNPPAERPAAARWSLVKRLTIREIGAKYKGSVLGLLWSLVTPLLLLAVYAFVFGQVFGARWAPAGTAGAAGGTPLGQYAIVLFVGLTTFQLFSEAVTRAPTVIAGHKNFVKKVVFPLEVLPVVLVGTALFQYAVSLAVILVAVIVAGGGFHPEVMWLPVILAPFLVLLTGLCWVLAALGPYLRDIAQVVGTAVSALLFLSPVFYPRETLPEPGRSLFLLNPLTVPVEQSRKALLWGQAPDLAALCAYGLVALLIAAGGYLLFRTVRPGFADVV
jgi:lipopolysaccharide transport system permease protein